jgi:hypothetical protein
MFEAQYLFRDNPVYGPWMERRGDNVRITADVAAPNASTLSVSLFQKNTEDAGDGTLVSGGSISATTVGRATKEYTGLKEIVRYKFEVTGGPAVLFRMLGPLWFDEVEA